MLTTFTYTIIGFCMCLLVVVTVAGNLLVCLAIHQDSRLRRTENLFLASLAATDLLVALLVMTFAGANDLVGYWMFGQSLCDCWIATDIMCSTASILNLCAVSLVRFLYIKDPFKYSGLITVRVATTSIAAIWVLSAAVSILPISQGHHRSSTPPSEHHPPTCALDLSPLYAVTSSIVSFYIPCLIMVFIYCRLYLYSRHHVKTIGGLCPCTPTLKDHKAAITIGVIMGIFLVCWLPFFSANILSAFCKSCVSPITFKVFSWLGYSNSMFNPIVYSIFNSEFRDSFKLILFRRHSQQSSLTSNQS